MRAFISQPSNELDTKIRVLTRIKGNERNEIEHATETDRWMLLCAKLILNAEQKTKKRKNEKKRKKIPAKKKEKMCRRLIAYLFIIAFAT